jgi:hypothetical protein
MTTNSKHSHRPGPLAIVMVPLVAALVLTLFAWPNAKLEPRDLPIGVAGAPAATKAIEAKLTARDGAFEVHRYGGEAAARDAIEDREVYGAFVATASGPKVLAASAASPAVAQLLSHAAAEAGGSAQAVPMEDVVPSSRGAALGSSVLPLVIAGILAGAAGLALTSGGLGRAGLVVAASVMSGLAATAIVQGWLDVVEGDWVANAAGLGLTVLAIGAIVAGLGSLLGKQGAALGALTMILIGNPFSGVGSAPELLPGPVGGLGQLLPPGAGGNLLRSTSFFDGAGAGDHVIVLASWALAGLAMLTAAAVRSRSGNPADHHPRPRRQAEGSVPRVEAAS